MDIKENSLLLQNLNKSIQNLIDQPDSVAVIFVLSVLGKSDISNDYDGFSISASFQRMNDMEDYISAFRKVGFYVQSFLNENEFFKWVIDGGYAELSHQHKFVYTSAINGTGPGRRALVPAFCQHMGIPTLNQNPYSSTVGRHKHNVSYLLSSLGVPSAKCWLIDKNGNWLRGHHPENGSKIIAKATYEGSSIGLDSGGIIRYTPASDSYLIDLAKRLRQPISVQEFLDGDEFEVPVFSCNGLLEAWPQVVMDNTGPISGDKVLDYKKVWSEDYKYMQSSSIPLNLKKTLKQTAKNAYSILEYSNIARIDIRLTGDGTAKVFDVSGTPDLAKMSSCASAVYEMGGSYKDLWLLALASRATLSL